MKIGEIATVEGRDRGTPRLWEQNLDRGLLARLGRRPNVISPVLGDRIQRRADYFTDRAQLLAKSLVDRVSRTEREVACPQVVHVGWRQVSPSITPDSAPASVSPTELRVVSVAAESATREQDATEVFPASIDASEELPTVTRSPAPPRTGGARPEAPADYSSSVASCLSERSVQLPQQLSTTTEDEVVTLTMPPVRGAARFGRGKPVPCVGTNQNYSEDIGEAVASVRPADLTPLNPAHSTVSADGKAGEPVAGTAPDTALADRSPSQQSKEQSKRTVTASPSRTFGVGGQGTLLHEIARPSPVQDADSTESIGEAGRGTAEVSQPSAQPPSMSHGVRESVGRVESVQSGESAKFLSMPGRVKPSQSRRAAGEAGTAVPQVLQVSPDSAFVASAPAAQSGTRTRMQPIVPPGALGPYISDHQFKSEMSEPAGTGLSPLPHTGTARPRSVNPAREADGAAVARDVDAPSGDSARAPLSSPLHVAVLTANAGGQSESGAPSQSSPAPIDEAQLARRIERRIMKRLAVDAERRGGWS